jgi:hypothetical protein
VAQGKNLLDLVVIQVGRDSRDEQLLATSKLHFTAAVAFKCGDAPESQT